MKLPRNAKIFRGQLDAAPFASVAFLLVIFLVLQSRLVFTPGIRIDLAEVPEILPGTANPTVRVAVDRNGLVYYDGQQTTLANLRVELRKLVERSKEPLTLEVQIDKAARWGAQAPLLSLARDVGMRETLLETRARPEPTLKRPGQ